MITIAELRTRNDKMTQQQLDDEIKVGVDSVRRWESNIYSALAENIRKICIYFDVSSDDLLGINKKIS